MGQRRGDARVGDTPRIAQLAGAAAIVAAAAAVRLVFAIVTDGSTPVLDETAYLRIARTLAQEVRFEGTFRPPLYPAFMAAVFACGGGTLAIRVIQALLSALSVALAFRIAHRTIGPRAGLVAAAAVGFDPVLIMFSHRLWSETLFVTLVLIALERLTSRTAGEPPDAESRGRVGRAGLTACLIGGACLGLATLARPVLLTFLPLVPVWAILDAGRSGRTRVACWKLAAVRSALIIGAALATITPWSIRNAVAARAFIPVDSNGPFNLLVGSEPAAAFVAKDNLWSRRFGLVDGKPYELAVRQDAAAAQRAAVRSALENIATDPQAYLRKCAWEAAHLWTLDSFLLRHLRNRWYGSGVPPWANVTLTSYNIAFSAGLTILACVGLAAAPRSGTRSWTLLAIVHACAVFGLTYALSRYAAPLRPLLAIFAAIPIAGPYETFTALQRAGWASPRVLGLAAAVLLLLLAWSGDGPLICDQLVTGGASHTFTMK